MKVVVGFRSFPRRVWVRALSLAAACVILIAGCDNGNPGTGPEPEESGAGVRLVNFDAQGGPLVRFDVDGNQVDSHGGEIEKFGDTYYWYGETYGCGWEWVKHGPTQFCGFRVYTSQNLTDWKDQGLLFDVSSWEPWQARCHGWTWGCFRPHVAFNAKTGRYVLWVNIYDKPVGYYVLEATSPVGPFVEVGVPRLAVNMDAPGNRINNGDHNLFVDDDGTGYLIYTDWVKGGDVVIERLTPDYLNGTGEHVRLGSVRSEAPTLFKRAGRYYAMVSSPPNHAYAAAATTYYTASAPLGPWSEAKQISANSCGGQPFHVSQLPTSSGGESWYLYQSDLWINSDGVGDGDANQAPAAMFWAPLSFTSNGDIEQIRCLPSYQVDAWTARPPNPAPAAYRLQCDISGSLYREFQVTVAKAGRIRSVSVPVYQRGEPDKALVIELRLAGGAPLRQVEIEPGVVDWSVPPNISWSARKLRVSADVQVRGGDQLAVRLLSNTTRGCYGFAFRDGVETPTTASRVSKDQGRAWTVEPSREPRVELEIE